MRSMLIANTMSTLMNLTKTILTKASVSAIEYRLFGAFYPTNPRTTPMILNWSYGGKINEFRGTMA